MVRNFRTRRRGSPIDTTWIFPFVGRRDLRTKEGRGVENRERGGGEVHDSWGKLVIEKKGGDGRGTYHHLKEEGNEGELFPYVSPFEKGGVRLGTRTN